MHQIHRINNVLFIYLLLNQCFTSATCDCWLWWSTFEQNDWEKWYLMLKCFYIQSYTMCNCNKLVRFICFVWRVAQQYSSEIKQQNEYWIRIYRYRTNCLEIKSFKYSLSIVLVKKEIKYSKSHAHAIHIQIIVSMNNLTLYVNNLVFIFYNNERQHVCNKMKLLRETVFSFRWL